MKQREIKFRPLRRSKKTGKIIVASYTQWRRIKTSDYDWNGGFVLVVNNEYKSFGPDELVHDHNGENLFWKDFNPEEIPFRTGYELIDGEQPPAPKMWKNEYMYSARGLDCSGVPAFSHGTRHNLTIGNMHNYTLEEVGEVLDPMSEYEPLTVKVVVWWLGWFLYQLKNNKLVSAPTVKKEEGK